MPRFSRTGELIFDPEVEKIACRTRKETRQFREVHSSASSQRPESEVEPADSFGDTSSDSVQEEVLMANARTLMELAAPDLTQQPLCITFPSLSDNTSFELKSGLIHLLPSFHGLLGEEPYKHLQEFDVVCNSMKPPEITEEQIKMRAFPFSLKNSTKDWLYYLPPGSITTDRSIIDAANGEALVNKTPRAAWELIEGMTENSQQFGTREDVPMRKVNEVETSSIQQQLTELTSFVRQLAVGNASQAKVCGVCTGMGHSTDMCPMIQEKSMEQVNIAGHAPAPRDQYDPYSNTYNPGWRDHPIFSYGGNRQSNFMPSRQQEYQQQYQFRPPPPPSSASPSLEDMMKQLMAKRKCNDFKKREGNSGAELVTPKDKDEEKIEKELQAENTSTKNPVVLPDPIIDVKTNPPLFPCRLEKSKKQDKEKEILEVFRKVEINIPLLDAIKQVPKFAKFLRDLCVNRKLLRGDERIIVGENVSAVLQRNLPSKCGDPGRFTVPCRIDNTLIRNTLLDLGASINVMPKSIYVSLNLGPLKETEIIIQLADRTNAYVDGLVEDVLVKVNELIFPADFYLLDMDDDHSSDLSPSLLGRPFFSATKTKIDVNKGTLSMKFVGELVHFNIFDTMEHPVNSHPVFAIHAINLSVQEFSEFAYRDKFKFTENKYKGMETLYEVKRSRKLRKKAALKGYLDPGGGPPIFRKIELHPD
ncbi:uncharacterized protein LOC113766225 [Coffea eugenioides]|uniref:uncharacterized protein LOC113766225 n=1 Tax=Coffea eugenioides TaxID=49369 RepID=UPI000F609883|nr:uncharacterized protein LOC113766225 [Coffea eugenioides]